ncbi:hypothetical protein GCM10022254_57270 [Actinomadura meridiana]|uniref:Uncharacterized protein n=1 Tax=Actinomadura meridiana TaxID=559626 RepID=A0ABP8CH79_9ACTN
MGKVLANVLRVRRAVLRWRTLRNTDTAIRYLDALVPELERRGRRCVKTYHPEVIPVRVPLLRVYGADLAMTLCVLAGPGGWGFYEAPHGLCGYLHDCDDIEAAARTVDHFLHVRSVRDE